MIWTLAKKDLRLLVRDPRALIILLAMPLVLIMVLGVSLGEGFGQKPDDRLRVSVLLLDEGLPRFFDRPAMIRDGAAWYGATPLVQGGGAGHVPALGALGLSLANRPRWFPHENWSELVLNDLRHTANIRVEIIGSMEEAERLVGASKRAAVLVLGPAFSKRVERCSFLAAGWRERFLECCVYPRPGDPVLVALAGLFDEKQTALPLYLEDGINPFFRDGVRLEALDVQVLRDETQQTATAIIDQVAQGTMLRVIMPWMIGRAFERIGDPAFLTVLGKEEQLPFFVATFLKMPGKEGDLQRKALSAGLQNALQNVFPKYNLTAKTWAALTKELEAKGAGAGRETYLEEGGGWLKRGTIRYQRLVPSYLVMFAFFLVLTVGWLFVAERRQGTMKRLVAAPLSRGQILLGKLIPCLALSLFQGIFLLIMGKLLFGMSWGPAPHYLLLVVASTSLAAMGLALLVAALARTETQVAIYGTLLVLVLAGLSGALMGDRELMPEQMQAISRFTPHAWALDAYLRLLTVPNPDLVRVREACAVLACYGVGFVLVAWWCLRLK